MLVVLHSVYSDFLHVSWLQLDSKQNTRQCLLVNMGPGGLSIDEKKKVY